jgi:hypothetical protein
VLTLPPTRSETGNHVAGFNPTHFTEKEKEKKKAKEMKEEKTCFLFPKYPHISLCLCLPHLFKSFISDQPLSAVVHGASEAPRGGPPGEEGAEEETGGGDRRGETDLCALRGR